MKRTIYILTPGLLLCCAIAPAADSQNAPGYGYPAKSIRLIVPWSAGGGTDLLARIIAQQFSDNLGRPIVIDNRDGASGIIGTDIVAKAVPDGYTLLMGNMSTNAHNASVFKHLPYDSLKDFTAVSQAAIGPYIMFVTPALPVKSVKEFIALAKSKPNQLNFGSGGNGSTPHIVAEYFNYLSNIKLVHVAYKSSAGFGPGVAAGEVQVAFGNPLGVIPHANAGRVRALAVTSIARTPAAPDLPTIAESGIPGFDFSMWWGILGPARMPLPVVNRLHSALNKSLEDLQTKEKLSKQAVYVVNSSPGEFAAVVRADVEKWKNVARHANIQLDY